MYRSARDTLPGRTAVQRRHVLLRLLWLGLTTLALVQFATAIPLLYRAYGQPCAAGCVFTPADAEAMAAWGLTLALFAGVMVALLLLFAFTCLAVGGLIFYQSWGAALPLQPFALYAALSLTLLGLSSPLTVLYDALAARRDPWSLVTIGLVALSQLLTLYLVVLFPDGRLAPRWLWAPLSLLVIIGIGGSFVYPLFVPAVPAWPVTRLIEATGVAIFFLAAGVQLHKYWHTAGPLRRRQTRWFVGAVAVAAAVELCQQLTELLLPPSALTTLGISAVSALLVLGLPLAIGVAVLRERLWDLPVVVKRALVYAALSACVIVVYVLLVGGLGALLNAAGDPLLAVLAGGVVALLALPLRDRLQRAINRLLYGERDDPYAVIARLGQELERASEPRTVLRTVVHTVATSLKLPYVAIRLHHPSADHIVACYGTPPDVLVTMPLVYREELLGELCLAPRGDDRDLTWRDRTLLTALARQAGIALEAARLTLDLQRSRERLVAAREEERRRLRRDLHDGVGPTLASVAQRLDTAGYLAAEDPQATAALLREIKGQVRASIADIRRVVDDLRPPVLDELGLAAAIRDQLVPAQDGGVTLSFSAPEHLPPLPAAVEVAVYRIVQEALANVVRHAGARSGTVRLGLEQPGVLTVEVRDDGRGLVARRRAGVGLGSMRERAEEVGGTFYAGTGPDGGTQIRAEIPLAGESGSKAA